jgi:hypothetical protein
MWDNSNLQEDIQWGNIELPGLSDEKLLTTNWTQVTAAKNRMANPATRKKLINSRKKQNTTEYLEHMSKQRLDSMDKPVDNSNKSLREKLTEVNRISAKNPIHYANRCAANKKMKDDPKWREAHAKGVLTYSEEVMTPMGIFPSMGQWMKKYNRPGGRSLLKALPHLFYLTKDSPGIPTYERIYHTPFGDCASDRHSYELAKKNLEPNALKLRNISGWWIKMAALYPKSYFIKFEVAKYWPNEKDIVFGIDELENKPRIKKDKLATIKSTWNNRLKHQKTLYKKK